MPTDLIALLRRQGPTRGGALARLLGISRPTLMRAVQAAGEQVIVRGRAQRTTYAARRPLRGSLAPLPLYRVDVAGNPREMARLHLAHPGGSALEFLEDFGWPLDEEMRDGWFEGLPYPLQDMRPQGFLGRGFARRHAALLQASENPEDWSDEDVLQALSLFGVDVSGDLLVGEVACRRWLEQVQRARTGAGPVGLDDAALEPAYPQLAAEALQDGVAGSSAGGEFPKFTALRRDADGGLRHVLVKFSGSDDTPGTRRWADLLVCEHLAGEVLRPALGIAAAASRIHRLGGRVFLEVDRFDRHGLLGRSGLVSWFALNAACFGTSGLPWGEAARRLAQRGWLSEEDRQRILRLWHFGQLIGNTDMHDGNLSFQQGEGRGGPALRLAPTYDMLPMLYAPVRGVELPPREWVPRLALPEEQPAWLDATRAALEFWERVAADERISEAFRRMAGRNHGQLRSLLSAA